MRAGGTPSLICRVPTESQVVRATVPNLPAAAKVCWRGRPARAAGTEPFSLPRLSWEPPLPTLRDWLPPKPSPQPSLPPHRPGRPSAPRPEPPATLAPSQEVPSAPASPAAETQAAQSGWSAGPARRPAVGQGPADSRGSSQSGPPPPQPSHPSGFSRPSRIRRRSLQPHRPRPQSPSWPARGEEAPKKPGARSCPATTAPTSHSAQTPPPGIAKARPESERRAGQAGPGRRLGALRGLPCPAGVPARPSWLRRRLASA